MVCAKRTKKNFDQVKVVLPMIFMSLGYTMVTLRSETLLYINTSYWVGIIAEVISKRKYSVMKTLRIKLYSKYTS